LPVIFSVLLLLALSAEAQTLRLNDIQMVGSHNSYHVAPAKEVLEIIGAMNPDWQHALDYTHLPLDLQLDQQNVRHFELDLFADPQGGHFASPMAAEIAKAKGIQLTDHDPDNVLLKPGIKVLHHQDFDYVTNHLTFKDALTSVQRWSIKHPDHIPILFLLELKDRSASPLAKKPATWDAVQMRNMEKEILTVFASEKLITPDSVRGRAKTLRDAVHDNGWPSLDDCRGKVMFALDNGGRIKNTYLKLKPDLKGALLFASVGKNHPAAAFFKINDPVGQFGQIQRLVKAGFLVRTRADADTAEARSNDINRRDKAFASGAHFISTDFPAAVDEISPYEVRLPNDRTHRHNPVRIR
jgi:hypothetical protein